MEVTACCNTSITKVPYAGGGKPLNTPEIQSCVHHHPLCRKSSPQSLECHRSEMVFGHSRCGAGVDRIGKCYVKDYVKKLSKRDPELDSCLGINCSLVEVSAADDKQRLTAGTPWPTEK